MRAGTGLRRLARLMLPITTSVALATGTTAFGAPAGSIQDGQWALTYLQVSKVWPITQGQGVTVAVIDTGVNATEADLAGQVTAGGDYGNGQSDNGLRDVNPDLHGTSMAAIIAGTGAGNGMKGLAPKAKIMSIGIGIGNGRNDSLYDDTAILAAVAAGVRVINLSYGTTLENPLEEQAVEYAIAHGVVVVAGVGNDGQNGNPLQYPAGLPGVIAVTEIDSSGNVPAEAEYGPQVVLAAPGYMVTQPKAGGGYTTWHGTSNATAYVSAAAALVLAVHPNYTATQVADLLIHTASPHNSTTRDPHYGYGIVNPYAALTTSYVPPPNANPLGADLTATNPDSGGHTSDGWTPGQITMPPPDSATAQPTSPSPDASAPAVAQPSNTSGGSSPLVPVLAGIGGALVLAGAGAWLIRRRRQSHAVPASPPWPSPPSGGPGGIGGPPAR